MPYKAFCSLQDSNVQVEDKAYLAFPAAIMLHIVRHQTQHKRYYRQVVSLLVTERATFEADRYPVTE